MILYIAKDDDGRIWCYRERPCKEDGRWYGGVVEQVPDCFLNDDEQRALALGKVMRAEVYISVTHVLDKHIED